MKGRLKIKDLEIRPTKTRQVAIVNLMVLIHNLLEAAKNPAVGFEDADQTLDQLLRKLNQRITVEFKDLESLLWSCNLLNEQGLFWDARGYSFDEFLRSLLKGETFNKDYNWIKEEV